MPESSNASQPIQTSPWQPTESSPAASPRPPVARFTIEKLHAQGGLGQVSLAIDGQLKRPVALKEIRPDRRTEEARRRFVNEAEITGQLEHPGIVPIYALETDAAGEPYYAMRFIQGRPMSEAIREYHAHRRDEPGGSSVLAFRDLLQRFVSVCQTMAYAHSKGVIHRDLKPANVMLGEYGETLVVDWGLAKRVVSGQSSVVSGKARESFDREPTASAPATTLPAPSDATQPGQALGTPAYMAPEQARGEWERVGPAADVFSLGAVLYELLTNQRPMHGKDVCEVIDNARVGQFIAPRRLMADIPKPQEAICLKAMAFKPEERYGTAKELAADVEHLLADEPVTAYAEPWTVRARRWGRRHRAVVSSVVVALLLGVAALAGITILVQRHATVLEIQRNKLAERNERALEAIETVASDAAIEQLSRETDLRPEQKEFLDKMIKYYAEYSQEAPVTEQERSRQARAYFQMGRLNNILVRSQDSETAYRHAVALYQKLAADFPFMPQYNQGLANSDNNLGNLLGNAGRFREAEAAHGDGLTVRKQLAIDFPTRPEFRQDLAMTYNNLGYLFVRTGRLKQAEEAYGDSLAIKKQLAAQFPNRPEFRQELARSHDNLADLFGQTGRLTAAEAAYADALIIKKQLVAHFPKSPEFHSELAWTQNNLGNLLHATGRLKEAECAFVQALGLRKQLAAEFPTRSTFRQDLAATHNDLGALLAATGRPKDAEAAYRDAVAIQKELANDFPAFQQGLARSYHRLGEVLETTGRLKEAETAYGDALAIRKQLAADFPTRLDYRRDLASSHESLGVLLHKTGRLEEAEAAYRDTLAIRRQLAEHFPTLFEIRQELALNYNNLGALFYDTARLKQAETAYREALIIQQQLTADFPSRPEYRHLQARTHNNLGALLRALGRPKEAEGAYRDALAIRKKLAAEFPTNTEFRQELAACHYNLGNLLSATDRPNEAEPAYAAALAIQRQLAANFADRPDLRHQVAATLGNLAHLANEGGNFQAARKYLEEAESHHQVALRANPRHPTYRQFYRNNMTNLVIANAGLQDRAGALHVAEKIRDLGWDPPDSAYAASLALAYCIPIVEKDDQLEAAKRQASLQFYADQVMAMLRDAVAKGYKDAPQMKQDAALAPLRQREDFKKLLKELEEKK